MNQGNGEFGHIPIQVVFEKDGGWPSKSKVLCRPGSLQAPTSHARSALATE